MSRPSLILDLGNVLIAVDHSRASGRVAARYRLDPALVHACVAEGEPKRLFDLGKLTPLEFTRRCGESLGITLDFDWFSRTWSDVFTEIAGAAEIVEEAAAQAKLILLSNTDPLHFRRIEQQFPFLARFDERVLSYEVGLAKPEKEIFEHTLGLCPDCKNTFFVDDIEANVRAARQHGIASARYLSVAQMRADVRRFLALA